MTLASTFTLAMIDEKPCECLGGRLWRTSLGAATFSICGVLLVWLIQRAQWAGPHPLWWKSILLLVGVLAATYFLRIARRLDSNAKQDWTIFDAGLLLAGGLMTGIVVMRSNGLAGAAMIAVFIVIESHSLWRLELLPVHRFGFLRRKSSISALASTVSAPVANQASPEELRSPDLIEADASDLTISQRLTRQSTAHGEVIRGFVRGRIEAGDVGGGVDIAFCPTFKFAPTLEFETQCEEELEVQISTLRTYGARIDFQRKGAVESELPFTLDVHIASESHHETDQPTHEPAGS